MRRTELETDASLEAHKQVTRECIEKMTQTYNLMEKDLRLSIEEQEKQAQE